MYYIIYETTNNLNNKKYRGVHQTNNLDDGYLGSGRALIESIEQNGCENFSRKILKFCDSSKEMYNWEKEYVNKQWVNSNDTYNLKTGGHGGWDHENLNSETQRRKWKKSMSSPKRKTKEYKEKMKIINRRIALNNWKTGKFNVEQSSKAFLGKHHTEETKRKMSELKKGKYTGKDNSQYGTYWIMNEKLQKSKKIKKEELQIWLDKGWIRGRKIKHMSL